MVMLRSQISRQIGTIGKQVAKQLAKRLGLMTIPRLNTNANSFRERLRIVRHNDSVMNHAFESQGTPLFR